MSGSSSGSRQGGVSDPAELVLRRADAADDAAIRDLLAHSYPDNPKRHAAFTRWQYWANPFGPTRTWVWTDPAGRVVTHWSVVPVPLVLHGRPVVGGKGVDIATDPAWRGRGLFRQLARRALADCRAEMVPAVLSHPNPTSAAAVADAGAATVAHVPVRVRSLDVRWLAARTRLPRPAAGLLAQAAFGVRRGPEADEVDELPDDLDRLWAEAAGDARCTVRRDGAWWRWRYADRPQRPYRLLAVREGGRLRGAAVTTGREAFGGRFVFVLEWLAVDDAAAIALGRSIATEAADGAVVAALPGTPIWRHAAAAGFRRLPRALEPRPLRFLVAAGSDGHGASARLARAGWWFAWGDLDHL